MNAEQKSYWPSAIFLLVLIFISFMGAYSGKNLDHGPQPDNKTNSIKSNPDVTDARTPLISGPSNQPTTKYGQTHDKDEPTAEVLTAWFTGALAVVSVIQAALFFRQLRFMREGIDDAKIVAEAAKMSAQAAVGVELPFLRVNSITPAIIEGCLSDNWIEGLVPVVEIQNYGRTPAFVSGIIINACLGKFPKREVSYIVLNEHQGPMVIEGRSTHKYTERYLRNNWLDKYKSGDVSSIETFPENELDLFIYGKIAFSDFIGGKHELGFIFSFDKRGKRFVRRDTIYKRYNYQT